MALDRLYRALLHLYPASFRTEYGGEMLADFRRQRRDAAGPVALALLVAKTLGDTLRHAAARHGDILRQDLRYTARTLRRAPGFALTAILLVSLGVGANTAAFSVTDFVLLRPLPFPEPDRLVKVWERLPGYSQMEPSPANYRDWTRMTTVFSSLGAWYTAADNMVSQGEPQRLTGASITASLLPTLGVTPLIGRSFTTKDEGEHARRTVILSYPLWQSTFGGDPAVLGRTVRLDEEPYEIVGVMRPDFSFPDRETLFWKPMRESADLYEDRRNNMLYVLGRLAPGTTLEQADAQMLLVAAQLRQQYPRENEHADVTVIPLREELSEQSRLLLIALCGAALCVLLIACANLANLLIARAIARRPEIAVRTAMGAGRERLVRQLATESLVLAAIGGIAGVLVARLAVPLLTRLVPNTMPLADAPAVNLRVLLFAAALTAITGLAFGTAPALRAASARRGGVDLDGLRDNARTSGGHKERLRSTLVIVEIIASVVLLVSGGLLLRALWTLQSIDPGFRAERVLSVQTALNPVSYRAVAKREAFYEAVLREVRSLPGVVDAGYTSWAPMTMPGGIWPVSVNGEAEGPRMSSNSASLRFVTRGVFTTLGIPLLRGRDVRPWDTFDRQSVAIVSQSFVERYWPGSDPIGRRFFFAFREREVVGVVGDVRVRGFERGSEPQVYLPSAQVPDGGLVFYAPHDLVIRTSGTGSPLSLVPAVRHIIREIDPTQPISDIQLMTDVVDSKTASRSVQVRVIGAFAIIAFLLAGVGIHGLLAFAVSQRSQEIGVRMALGAQPRDILRMVMGRSLVLAVAGIVPGVGFAYLAARAMQSLLAGIRPDDTLTFGAAIVLALVMMLAGSLVPTLRALRIDPVQAIRVR